MKKQRLTSFYLEALLLVVIFVAMILVLTGVFGAARVQSTRARRLTVAVTLAANAAEAMSAAEDLPQAAALLDEGGNVRLLEDRLEAAYALDGRPCPAEEGALRLVMRLVPSAENAAFVTGQIDVYAAGDETPVYTLETGRCGKGASS